MPADTIIALRPLVDFVDPVDIPLHEFLDIDAVSILDDILVADVWTDLDGDGFTLGAEFRFPGINDLHLPGLDLFKLSFNPASTAKGVLTLSDDPSLVLDALEIVLQIDPAILRTPDGSGAKLATSCGLRFDRDGFHVLTFGQISLIDVLVAGTDIKLSLIEIRLGATPDVFLQVKSGTVTLPMFEDAAGNALVLDGSGISLGRDGPSGKFARRAGPALTFSIYGFSCEIEEASIRLERGQLVEVTLNGRMDLGKFLADGRDDGWVDVDFSIGPGGLIAALSDDEPIIEMTVDGAFHLGVDTIRLEAGGKNEDGTLWLSGELTPDIEEVDGTWPSLAFNEIGIGPKGGLRLAEGATIATTEPFVLNWNCLNLTVTAFSLQRPRDAPQDLELRITASVELLAGLPAGASVDGLVVRRHADGRICVRFDGIGITFTTPGGFAFAASISWDSVRKALSGTGYLDIPSLDMRLDVVVASASETVGGEQVTTFFLAAEAELVPGGIPIGTTGLSLYGVSGLLAYNLALKVATTGPRRFFDAFMLPKKEPKGFAARSKWEAAKGSNALGLGVVIGTADDGWVFSARGALMISIPDLTILLTATGEILKERQPMNAKSEGKLAALLAVYPAEKLVRLDFSAQWQSDPLFDVEGSGEGMFYVDRPLDWSVKLGKRPGEGKPVAARVLRLDSNWMLESEFWLGLDAARQANVGLRSHVELRAGVDGLYAELVGSVGSQVTLAWNPAQFEGQFGLGGRARLVAGGLSLGFNLSAGIDARIARPTLLEIPLRSCIEIDLGLDTIELCLAFTFRWRDEKVPDLKPMLHGLSAVPRHWTPRAATGVNQTVDDGIVSYVSDQNSQAIPLGRIAPHSELVLELSKSMFVDLPPAAPVKLNDVAKPYPQQIGENSGWLAQWSIKSLELYDRTLGAPVDLFGTFSRSPVARSENGEARSPRPPNSSLRLLSSRRYGQDGSLGGGGAEDTPPSDCAPKPDRTTKCILLAGLATGYGFLSNGWLYHWRADPSRPQERDNRYGVGMAVEELFRIWPPEGIDAVEIHVADYLPKKPPVPGTEGTDRHQIHHPEPINYYTNRRILLSLCWEELLSGNDSSDHQDWHGSSGAEEWTLTADQRLLIPTHNYELKINLEGQLKRGTGSVGPPLQMDRTYSFTADRAPYWAHGLCRAVAALYPDDGRRPVYRDYDLFVLFKDDFFNALYTLDNRVLGVRLRDANGNVVSGAAGHVLLPTAWEQGPIVRSPVEHWWGRARAGNPADPCEVGIPPPPDSGETVLPIKLKDLHLDSQTRYIAELIAVDIGAGQANPTPPLAQWSFTTSRFATFTVMATPPSRVPAFGMAQLAAADTSDFNGLIRSFGTAVVAVVEDMRMTPVRARDALTYMLIEAPEPLDDAADRLSVAIAGAPAALAFNLDRTRLIATLAQPIPLTQPNHSVDVTLTWDAAPATAAREMQRTIGGVATPEIVHWRVPLERLFG